MRQSVSYLELDARRDASETLCSLGEVDRAITRVLAPVEAGTSELGD
jgi:hypothetical protein